MCARVCGVSKRQRQNREKEMEEVNLSLLGYMLHCSQPNSISLLQVQQQLLKLCAFCTFLLGPAVLK